LKQAQKTGPLGYIVKPFNPRELEIIIAAGMYKVNKKRHFKNIDEQCCFCLKKFCGITFRRNIEFTPIFIHGEVVLITGYNADDFISNKLRWENIIHPDDRQEYSKNIYKNLKMDPDSSNEKEYRIICKDGNVRWVRNFIRNICDDFGKPIGIQDVIMDITEARSLKQILEEKSTDLNLFKCTTVERENMMIELKQKVNSLREKLGETPEYDLSFLENEEDRL